MPSLPSLPSPPPPLSSYYTTLSSRWQALVTRDNNAANAFIYAVTTTKIYCRPNCKARLARRANVVFYDTAIQAEKAGFRACKRCKPGKSARVKAPVRRTSTVVESAVQQASVRRYQSGGNANARQISGSDRRMAFWAASSEDSIDSMVEGEGDGDYGYGTICAIFTSTPLGSNGDDDLDYGRRVRRVSSDVRNHRTISSHADPLGKGDDFARSSSRGHVFGGMPDQNLPTVPHQDADPDADPNTLSDTDTDTDPDEISTKIQRAVHLIRNTARDKGRILSLSQLSQQVGLSKWHLQRVFKRLQGVTPREMAEQVITRTADKCLSTACTNIGHTKTANTNNNDSGGNNSGGNRHSQIQRDISASSDQNPARSAMPTSSKYPLEGCGEEEEQGGEEREKRRETETETETDDDGEGKEEKGVSPRYVEHSEYVDIDISQTIHPGIYTSTSLAPTVDQGLSMSLSFDQGLNLSLDLGLDLDGESRWDRDMNTCTEAEADAMMDDLLGDLFPELYA